jgi:DNA-binding MarR family transcriptional regulator
MASLSQRRARRTTPVRRRADLPGLLSSLVRTIDGRVQSRLLRLGYGDVRPGHLALLLQLDRVGARGSDLARRSGMTKQSMAELVRELELADYVERRPDPRDGRARLIQPTGRGLMLIAHARESVTAVEAEAARRLGHERFVELQRALTELTAPEPSDDAAMVQRPLRGIDIVAGEPSVR